MARRPPTTTTARGRSVGVPSSSSTTTATTARRRCPDTAPPPDIADIAVLLRRRLAQGSVALSVTLSVLLGGPAPPSALAALSTNAPLDLERYAGTWYEVASLKKGFAGEGQKDCHCTAGLYSQVDETHMTVKTFCVHGSPKGKISGIEGRVACKPLETESDCRLNFPSIPFIPAEPYKVLDTDYTSFALVEGAKDASFVQVYTRKPNPPKAFIKKQIKTLETDYGYPKGEIALTPQDCDQALMTKMDSMMKSPGMTSMFQNTTENTIEELLGGGKEEDIDGIAFQGPRNPLKEAKDLLNLFRMDL